MHTLNVTTNEWDITDGNLNPAFNHYKQVWPEQNLTNLKYQLRQVKEGKKITK